MALEKILALALPIPMRGALPAPARPAPHAGETLQLTIGDTLLDEVLATTADGMPLRLSGLGALVRQLQTGDVLLMRVMSTSPRLELALFDTPSPAARSAPPQAMQSDQLSQRQMSWHPPQAQALAASWRGLVLGQIEADAARHAERRAGTAPAPRLEPSWPFAHAELDSSPLAGPHRWLFPAYAWAGLHLMLRLVEADPDEAADSPRQRRARRGPMSLQIEIDTPLFGGLVLQIQAASKGVALLFFVERDVALPLLKQALPTLKQALADAGLTLLRCGVIRGVPQVGGRTRLDALPSNALPSALLPLALFRAAAEVAVVLAPLLPARNARP